MSTIAQYHCDKCGMEFPSIASLEVHNWSRHSSQRSSRATNMT
jgi:hypothetical protein